MVRAFLAIEPEAPCRRQLAEAIQRLRRARARVAWVRDENLHLTLLFLGELPREELESHYEDWSDIVKEFDAFRLTVHGVQLWPGGKRARVVWACCPHPPSPLIDLAKSLRSVAGEGDAPKDHKVFRADITLGRLREQAPRELRSIVDRESGLNAGAFKVRTVSLFKSVLTPRGSQYERLMEFPLGWNSS